ncbi:MAG: hypothetical protein SFU20_14930 [Chitinophagaceae bacterium]|nr:hypothetical protein [Chitinophagaceae bacterium]
MIKTTKARIFLSERRGHFENRYHRAYHSVYTKDPVGKIVRVEEHTLAPGSSLVFTPLPDESILVLPIVGGVESFSDHLRLQWVDAGEWWALAAGGRQELEFRNPHPELINFLLIGRSGPKTDNINEPQMGKLLLEDNRQGILTIPVNTGSFSSIHIGKMGGRMDVQFEPAANEMGMYFQVIQGAFELEGRLLQPGDGLAMDGWRMYDIEALSEDAILLGIPS